MNIFLCHTLFTYEILHTSHIAFHRIGKLIQCFWWYITHRFDCTLHLICCLKNIFNLAAQITNYLIIHISRNSIRKSFFGSSQNIVQRCFFRCCIQGFFHPRTYNTSALHSSSELINQAIPEIQSKIIRFPLTVNRSVLIP